MEMYELELNIPICLFRDIPGVKLILEGIKK